MDDSLQALFNRKAQLLAQEQASMNGQPAAALGVAPVPPPVMTQAQFGGPPRAMTPQQLQQLAMLLARR